MTTRRSAARAGAFLRVGAPSVPTGDGHGDPADGRREIRRAVTRIAHEILERNKGAVGRRPGRDRRPRRRPGPAPGRGDRSGSRAPTVPVGALDITFYRDDIGLRAEAPEVHETRIPFDITGRTVVLVDDVLFTGRTIRAALDALVDFGRPRADPARRPGRPRPSRAADPAPTSSARTSRPASDEDVQVRARGDRRRGRRGARRRVAEVSRA